MSPPGINEVTAALVAVLIAGAVFFAAAYAVRRLVVFFTVDGEAAAVSRRAAHDEGPSYLQRLLRVWSGAIAHWVPPELRQDLERRIIMAGGLDGLTPAQVVLYAIFATCFGLALGVLLVVATGWPVPTVLGC